MLRPRALLRIGWALAVAIGTGCGAGSPSAPPNIVLISIDSLRPDHLGAYGYERDTSPTIDRLAREGARFENVLSTTSWTLPAHAALFTGLYDSTHGLVDNGQKLDDGHVTLAEVLKARGYETAGFFGGPYLHPVFGLSQGFDVYQSCMTTTDDDARERRVRREARLRRGRSHKDITGPRTQAEIARWAEARTATSPYFLFVHLWDVHYDFVPPSPFDEIFDTGYKGGVTGRLMTDPNIRPNMGRRGLEHVISLYDGEIRWTDHVLDEILADLASRGMLENTLVVITSDHGEEFFEHRSKGHAKSLFDEVLKVPLIFWWPDALEAGLVVSQQVRLVDLFPTLAGFAGATGLVSQGRDIAPLLRGEPMEPAPSLAELYLDGRSQHALRTDTSKSYRFEADGPAYLYSLDRDPEEKNWIAPGDESLEEERARAERELDEAVQGALHLRELLGDRKPGNAELPDELAAELQSLGYLDGP
jgi:arylsulfatase A-like enzyme